MYTVIIENDAISRKLEFNTDKLSDALTLAIYLREQDKRNCTTVYAAKTGEVLFYIMNNGIPYFDSEIEMPNRM